MCLLQCNSAEKHATWPLLDSKTLYPARAQDAPHISPTRSEISPSMQLGANVLKSKMLQNDVYQQILMGVFEI